MHNFTKEKFHKAVLSLSSKDKTFKKIFSKLGYITFQPKTLDFISFCRIIIGQQLSSKAANTIFDRFQKAFTPGPITPDKLLNLDKNHFKALGISAFKSLYIIELANTFRDNPEFLQNLNSLPSKEVFENLIALKGVGPWTANIIQLGYFGDLDIFPIGDATLEKMYSKLYKSILSSRDKSSYDVLDWAAPYRGVLALYLWDFFDRDITLIE